ncbi:MAG TPA: hypothetical protein VJ983_03550 [candidate division Zixibacteria bacterium]|nr:hypothetical protein [candidate division Zixibacteria bacterium]
MEIRGKDQVPVTPGENPVLHRCLMPDAQSIIRFPLERDKPWSLPKHALAPDFNDTIHVLVLRFNFQYENPDDPNTTGRGLIDDTTSQEVFADSAGHSIDPTPHDSLFFDAQMRALREYYETVSEGKLTLTWDIYPPARDSAYQLPRQMSAYGKCDLDSVVSGLEQYFIDCIQLADTAEPEIVFSNYQSIFLFHAGSDRQNDIGFPRTCNDLFTGFISFKDSIGVDHDSAVVRTALIMPETASQDNRATALNAVMAHEFGHQLGLVDLYSTRNFMSMLGDFALMDDNGFGSGIDFGFPVGKVFGAIPLYPMAWSRAYLGFVPVHDFRKGTDIHLAAAEVLSNGYQIARVPITEKEYYLIENRVIDLDGQPAAALADSATNVILGPTDLAKNFNREYDFLMPGSGVLIFHVDESVAGMDYNYDGDNNFDDNQLQWAFDIYGNPVNQFITLVEADGIVDFGGYYRSGYGSAEDMFRDDRNHSFTPNTNPPTIDNTGNNSHIYITNIGRVIDSSQGKPVRMDTLVSFDVETDRLAQGFPVRGGHPTYGLSPIADDLDGDGTPEIIFASGKRIEVTTLDGQNFLRQYTGCTSCPLYYDTAVASVNAGQPFPIPLYVDIGATITSGPVTGLFADYADSGKFIAVGKSSGAANGEVDLYQLHDVNSDGQADPPLLPNNYRNFATVGTPVALSYGNTLYAVTDSGYIYRKDSLNVAGAKVDTTGATEIHGICRDRDALIMLGGNSLFSSLYYYDGSDTASIALDDKYTLGPILVDIDLDGRPEVVAATEDGRIIMITVDTSSSNRFSVLGAKSTGYSFSVNPIAGDVDLDGYPDIIFSGKNAIYAFNYQLTMKTGFPIEINDKYPNDEPVAAPLTANVEGSSTPEILVPTAEGNLYSFGLTKSYGFPLSAGEIEAGSPVFVNGGSEGMLGYLGADGWFYLWRMNHDTTTNFWPMGGADPAGTFSFKTSSLPAPKQSADLLPKEKFYSYPNPVVDGSTTIRYFLGASADKVKLDIYDLSGERVAELSGPSTGSVDNELVWNCGDVTPGVYRCVISADFAGSTKTAFTDIAVIK